jgi:hypothetical protein
MTTVGELLAAQTAGTTSQVQPPTEGGTTVITPVSAKPAAQLTAEERERRYKDLRQRMGKPRLEVRGEPGIHYLWASRSDANELDRLDLVGYTIVRCENAKEVLAGKAKPKIEAGGLREDGTYIQGDVFLMQVDEEIYEFIMLENERKSNNQQSSAKENFIYEAEQKGVPSFEVDKSKSRR